jgi:hypothetical protein
MSSKTHFRLVLTSPLVALSFLFTKGPVGASLKVALTLTAAVAVLLGCIRFFKVACLASALGFALYWLWTANIRRAVHGRVATTQGGNAGQLTNDGCMGGSVGRVSGGIRFRRQGDLCR